MARHEIVIAYVGLGSNVGPRTGHLRRAVSMLARRGDMALDPDRDLSCVYDSAPVGVGADHGRYLNAVARVATRLDPIALMRVLGDIERALGRVRAAGGLGADSCGAHDAGGSSRSAPSAGPCLPRTIDLDLLIYGTVVIDGPDLTVPHPRLHRRRFVLEPLAELAGEDVHPRLGLTIHALNHAARIDLGDQHVRRRPAFTWARDAEDGLAPETVSEPASTSRTSST